MASIVPQQQQAQQQQAQQPQAQQATQPQAQPQQMQQAQPMQQAMQAAPQGQNKVFQGRCKKFDPSKGFGFITLDDGSSDIFVHYSEIQVQGFKSLAPGERVEFELIVQEDGRRKAVNVTGPGGAEVIGQKRQNNNFGGGGGGGGGGFNNYSNNFNQNRGFGGGRGGGRGGYNNRGRGGYNNNNNNFGGNGGGGGYNNNGGGGGGGGGGYNQNFGGGAPYVPNFNNFQQQFQPPQPYNNQNFSGGFNNFNANQ